MVWHKIDTCPKVQEHPLYEVIAMTQEIAKVPSSGNLGVVEVWKTEEMPSARRTFFVTLVQVLRFWVHRSLRNLV